MSSPTVILSAARTPLGAFQGALSSQSAPQLGAVAIRGALARAGLPAEAVTQTILGLVLPAGVGQAPARQAAKAAGIPDAVPALTVNKVCGSGLQAILLGHASLRLGENEFVVAGGMESMTRAPYLVPGGRDGLRLGHGKILDSMIHDGLWDPYRDMHMGNCGEICAAHYRFTREEQDAYSWTSFERALAAQQSGAFTAEIEPVPIESRGKVTVVSADEGPAKGSRERMRELRPAFQKDGTITAGNASTINDGAAALVLGTEELAVRRGLTPLARVVSWGGHAQAPEWFTTAPVQAARQALARAGWTAESVDLWECNEAFAVVAMAFQRELGIPPEKLNVRGGAVSLGHPIGASGARIVTTLLHALRSTGGRRGCAAICLGGGEGLALCIERV